MHVHIGRHLHSNNHPCSHPISVHWKIHKFIRWLEKLYIYIYIDHFPYFCNFSLCFFDYTSFSCSLIVWFVLYPQNLIKSLWIFSLITISIKYFFFYVWLCLNWCSQFHYIKSFLDHTFDYLYYLIFLFIVFFSW